MNGNMLTEREAKRVIDTLDPNDQEWVRAYHIAELESNYQRGWMAGRLTDIGAWVVGVGLLLGGVFWSAGSCIAAEQAANHVEQDRQLTECRADLRESNDFGKLVSTRCLERVVCQCEERL